MSSQPSDDGGSVLRAILLAGAAGAAILSIYLVHPALSGYHLPVGPDGPVYTWLARLADARGFVDAPGGGPGVPALTLFLGSILRIEPVETVTLLGPVLAAAGGLAAGALLETTLGRDRVRALVGALLTAAFTAFLAGGWLANVAMVAVFLAALATLSGVGRSWTNVWAGAALLTAAGLAHRIFIVIGAVILLAAAGWRLLRARGAADQRRTASRLALAAVAGPGAALLTGAWIASGPHVPGDTSQDGFFRRNGLRALLLDRYRERFLGDSGRTWIPGVAGIALAAPWAVEASPRGEGERFLRDVLLSWAAVTVAGIVALFLTGWGPPYRLIQFGFFFPLAAAAGFSVHLRASRVRAVLAVVLAGAFAAASMVGWFRQTPAFTTGELDVATRAGSIVTSLPDDTPLLFLVDTEEGAAAYHVTRAANVIRMGVPAERINDVRIVVGRPEDLLAGRPTISGDREHDRLSEIYLREAMPLGEDTAIIVLRRFNAAGFEEAEELGVTAADGVVVIPGPAGELVALGEGTVTPPESDGLALPELILLSLASLIVLGLAGWGWSRWMLGDGGPLAAAMAAASTGLAVVILSAVAADRLGLLPGGGGALAATGVLAVAGYVLAARR